MNITCLQYFILHVPILGLGFTCMCVFVWLEGCDQEYITQFKLKLEIDILKSYQSIFVLVLQFLKLKKHYRMKMGHCYSYFVFRRPTYEYYFNRILFQHNLTDRRIFKTNLDNKSAALHYKDVPIPKWRRKTCRDIEKLLFLIKTKIY